mmetsp:Transcript_94304/g.266297  ORF Transcript_94304/g.266297 Transcript_94304/m.266297 type:complete len:368 (-) Transcript_94304:159-1262(-)
METAAHEATACERGRILFYGNLCVDHVFDVPTYPKENQSQRASVARKSIGGNAGNSTRVLSQLQGARSCVSWLGPVPRRDDPDTIFALAVLGNSGVETSLLEEVGGDGLPSSFIISSEQTGSRTIVSTRNGVRELGVAHFSAALTRAFSAASDFAKPRWCHLECRQPPRAMVQLAEAWRAEAKLQSPVPALSVEVEKPAIDLNELLPVLQVCDHAFFSQEFVEANCSKVIAVTGRRSGEMSPVPKRPRSEGHAVDAKSEEHVALRFLRAISERAGPACTSLICPWGEHGAFAWDGASRSCIFEPAHSQPQVVDSVGAGDTFVAAYIHAVLLGAGVERSLRCACAVAGRKVGQVGFAALRDACPSDML